MAVYRLKPKQTGRRCSYCEKLARYRGSMFVKVSCEVHLANLKDWDKKETAPDYSDAAFIGGFQ